MSFHYIIMGDVISSGNQDSKALNAHFDDLISDTNKTMADAITSAYTITLGDEFQGVAASLSAAIQSVFHIEELILKKNYAFKLRYVVYFGEISTEINPGKAHGMLGSGLTNARKLITGKKRDQPRFRVKLENKRKTDHLNLCFRLIDGLTGRWNKKDYSLICDMIDSDNNQEVGLKHNKDRSQIYKRRKTLNIEEYKTAKTLLFSLT